MSCCRFPVSRCLGEGGGRGIGVAVGLVSGQDVGDRFHLLSGEVVGFRAAGDRDVEHGVWFVAIPPDEFCSCGWNCVRLRLMWLCELRLGMRCARRRVSVRCGRV
jgi:hypothetical protein